MSFLNVAIPNFKCFVREKFLYDGDESKTGFVPGVAFGAASIPGRVLSFHVLLDNGAVWWRLPIYALCWYADAQPCKSKPVLWDCFAWHMSVTQFPTLHDLRVSLFDGTGGRLKMTFDWAHTEPNLTDPNWSMIPEEHKCGHFIELDDGNYALMPNNKLRFHEASFAVEDLPNERYKRMTKYWSAEE